MHGSRGKAAGYSLVELMIVVAMIGVVTIVTVPAFVQIMPQYRIRGAASETVADFRSVRQMAVSNRRAWKITFMEPNDASGGDYWFYYSQLTSNDADMSDKDNWVSMGRDLRPLGTRLETARMVRMPAVTMDWTTEKPLHDVDDDGFVDLIYLRDGTVSDLPFFGGDPVDDRLDFELDEPDEQLPSLQYKIDNNFVRFNTYTFWVSQPGGIKVEGSKE